MSKKFPPKWADKAGREAVGKVIPKKSTFTPKVDGVMPDTFYPDDEDDEDTDPNLSLPLDIICNKRDKK